MFHRTIKYIYESDQLSKKKFIIEGNLFSQWSYLYHGNSLFRIVYEEPEQRISIVYDFSETGLVILETKTVQGRYSDYVYYRYDYFNDSSGIR